MILKPGVETLCGLSFYECTSLTSIEFPETLTLIGDLAFSNCSSLLCVTIPGSVKKLGGTAFSYCTKLKEVTLEYGVETISGYCFTDCAALERIQIPATLTTLDDGVFYNCASLTEVTIPGSIPEIGDNTFFGCTSLTSVTLPETVSSIGSLAFRECAALTSVNIPDAVQVIEESAFFNCSSLQSIHIPEGVEVLSEWVFFNCSALKELQIPESVHTIGSHAIRLCSGLTEIEIPENVTYIGVEAFRDCTGLTSVVIPDKVTIIDDYAFSICNALSSVEIGNGVQTIGDYAFAYCGNLQDVTLGGSVKTIGDYAFTIDYQLPEINIPNSVETIGSNAFSECGMLETITIPDSVISVGSSAFSNCYGMNSAWILGRDTVLNTNLFENTADGFTIYGHTGSTAQTYAANNGHIFRDINNLSRTLTVTVHKPDGEAVSDGFTVTWYDENGTVLAEGAALSNADSAKTYTYSITLDSCLALWYVQPETGTISPTDGETAIVTLAALPAMTLRGQVTDQNSRGLSGASVSVATAGSDQALTVQTDASGSFSLEIPRRSVSVRITRDGYYSTGVLLSFGDDAPESYDMGTVSMTETVTDRISMSLSLTEAAEDPSSAPQIPVPAGKTFSYALTRSDGSAISAFELQGTDLIFAPDVVSANEQITITVTDPGGEYVCPQPVTVTLNDEKLGSAQINLVQKGRIGLTAVTNCEAFLNLFDSQGRNIWSAPAQARITSAPLDAGNYTLVLIQRTSLLCSVAELSYLSHLGLQAGTDYLKLNVKVEDGKITRLSECAVPTLDESKLSYTAHHSAEVNKPAGIAPGELFMLRLEYELDTSKNVSAETIQVVLPAGISPAGSVALLNSASTPCVYDSAARTVSVDVSGRTNAVVYLYLQAGSAAADYSINGCLKLSGGILQPLGTAIAPVQQASVSVPPETRQTTVIAQGKTAPYATVTLFDNGEQVARTSANAAGSWSTELTLAGKLYSYSCHFIQAQIHSDVFAEPVKSEQALIIYDERTVNLDRITMYNIDDFGENEVVFDFTSNSTTVPHYQYNPDMPTFSFKAKFSGGAEIKEAYVVTADQNGKETYVELAYDAVSGMWVGSHDYPERPPAMVGAAYTVASQKHIPMDKQWYEDQGEMVGDASEKLMGIYSQAFPDNLRMDDYDEDAGTGTMIYTDPETQEEQVFASLQMKVTDVPGDMTAASLEEQGYIKAEAVNDSSWTAIRVEDAVITIRLVDLTAGTIHDYIMDFSQAVQNQSAAARRNGIATAAESHPITDPSWFDMGDAAGVFSNFLPGNWSSVGGGASLIATLAALGLNMESAENSFYAHLGILWDSVNNLYQMMNAVCPDGTYKLTPEERDVVAGMIDTIEARIREYATRGNLSLLALTYCNAPAIATTVVNIWGMMVQAMPKITPGTKAAVAAAVTAVNYGQSLYSKFCMQEFLQGSDEIYNSIMDEIAFGEWYVLSKINEIQYGSDCKEKEDPDPNPLEPKKPANVEWDPSGYVYEAVPSNRLEGVTAVVYYKASDGTPTRWNAENYDQINPQITGADGAYRWDVTVGEWMVKFSMDGYEDADTTTVPQANASGWLPVPPPQLNINVGMVSTAAPVVETAVAYTGQVELVFSQYMDIESVENAVTLTRNNADTDAAVVPLNAEYDTMEENQYATRFAVIPEDADTTGSLTVSVDSGAENYAGTPMESDYTSTALYASEKPTAITAPDSVAIGTNEEYMLSVTLQPCIVGQTLLVESHSENLVEILTAETITDENGRAVITMKGLLPGAGQITVTEPLSGISRTIRVDTAQDADSAVVQPVTAQLENGTVLTTGMTVAAGSHVILSTQTEGAQIRYTLNNTCPCKETALIYSDPIVVTEDTMLRAAAYLDGVFSETIKLKLTVTDGDVRGDLNADGFVDDSDVAHLLWYTLFPDSYALSGDADFNGDDSVDDADVAHLLWHILFPDTYPL